MYIYIYLYVHTNPPSCTLFPSTAWMTPLQDTPPPLHLCHSVHKTDAGVSALIPSRWHWRPPECLTHENKGLGQCCKSPH